MRTLPEPLAQCHHMVSSQKCILITVIINGSRLHVQVRKQRYMAVKDVTKVTQLIEGRGDTQPQASLSLSSGEKIISFLHIYF